MADINQTDVQLNVNNQEAKRSLDEVKKKLAELEAAWVKTATTGDKQMRDKLNKQIQATKRELRQMESGAKACERVFLQMNKATPNELRKALNHLQSELKNIERGTPAWDAHVAKIKQVKAELDKINAEMKQSESLMVRMKNKINDWGAMAAGGVAAMTGVVMAGKKAVQSYAEMEQEMANVRKYTGMTAEQVEHLNEAFKHMDTRTSREGLNQLAQEAGRLGMQSEEDVLGFVKAADKINVALDDLGDGATLTLSKLTDIFGDKQALGTERSLLAVGSVINELSQNSTAAAPYLAEFAQRLAGVGAQAHMTIPEIMGFGAVLDSQGQKLEMSSTALSKVIMNLFKDPSKIAAATGLEIEKFAETCKKSTNEGLLMLLDRLHELGGIDALAPVFKDMGENGARASAVLAALAGNVDMVRQQQEAANVAFNEAVSIDKEFNVQNTTVQAGLEKARKGFTEMAVTLGKELMPIVSKVISSTSMTMRVMLKVIQFVKEYRGYIIALTAAIVAYYTVMKAQEAWNAFIGGIKKAITAVRSFNAALMSNPYAAVAALILGIGIALMTYIKRSKEAAAAADAHRKALERQQEAEKRTASAVGEVIGKYQQLKAEWERLSTAQEKKAWLDKNRDAFEQLGLHINNAVEADDAFIKSSEKVVEALKARAKAEALQDLYKEKQREAYEKAVDDAQKRQHYTYHAGSYIAEDNSAESMQKMAEMGLTGKEDATIHKVYQGSKGYATKFALTEQGAQKVNEYYAKKAQEDAQELTKQYTAEVDKIYGDMYTAALNEAASAEAKTGGLMGDKPTKVNPNPEPIEGTPDEKELKKQHEAALKAVEDWKKKENAINQIAYLQGEKDHCDYTERSKEIDVEYWQKRMAVEKEGSAEYLEAQAKMLEAKKKQDEFYTKGSIEEEQRGYAELKATIDQNYADGKMSAKTYQLALEAAELDHLKAMVELYDEGSEERLKAEERYQQRSTAIQLKHVQEHEKIMEKMKKSYFSMVESLPDEKGFLAEMADLNIAYDELSKMQLTKEQELELEEAFQQAKFDIAKKYNMQSEMEALDSAQATYEKMVNLFQSKGAKEFISAYSTMVNGLNELFSGVTDYMDAEVSLQTALIEKRYEAEIAAAGNNKDLVEQLEADKEAEIAKMKTEAADKEFKMNIAMAIAQGALSAINAWNAGVGAGFPAGLVLGPVMLAMSLAATGLQIAAMTKQHEAAMAQGYAAGGYTAPGGKYQPAGIVHAGEWVASQELLANPTAAATIAQLDQAQRTNTIGQLSKPAPVVSSANDRSSGGIMTGDNGYQAPGVNVGESIDRLNKTLDGGIYAATLMTGDKGILRQQRRYEQLMRNKSKK